MLEALKATEIREAAVDDLPRIVELGRKFLLEGPYHDQIMDNPECSAGLASRLLQNDAAKMLVFEEDGQIQGVFCFVLFPHYFSGELTAGELIWYVEPGYRGRGSLELLWAAEHLAHALGAKRMQLTAPTMREGELYKRLKYQQIEISYQCELTKRVRPCQ